MITTRSMSERLDRGPFENREDGFSVTPTAYVESMELIELVVESNSGLVIDLGGTPATCPACAQSYDQLALDFDMSGIEALNCPSCGVVAA